MLSGPPDAVLFEALFERNPDGIVVVDRHGKVVSANAASHALLGHPPGALVGRPVEELIPARFGEHARLRTEFSAHARPRRGQDLFARHADGRDIPVDVSLTPVSHGEGQWVACVLRDARQTSQATDALRVQATALRAAANGVVITDRRGVIAWVNPAACAITGYSAEELVGQNTRLLKSGRHSVGFYQELWQTVARGDTWSGTIVNRRKDGSEYQEEQTIAPVSNEQGQITHYIAIKQDVSDKLRTQRALEQAHAELAVQVAEVQELNRQLSELSVRDALTGLHNRRYLAKAWPLGGARVQPSGEPVAVALIDLDHFKQVNDTHGHAAGDQTLVMLADVLRGSSRGLDLLCRVGGEEFLAVMPGTPHEVALRRADRWRTLFKAQPVRLPSGAQFTCTLSAGVAELRPDESLEATMARADEALYRAKTAGRDRVASAESRGP